jgi:hypothetical protein
MKAKRFQNSDAVFAPSELEFLAEEELVTIISKVSTSETDSEGRQGYLSLLAGAQRYKPAERPRMPTAVPMGTDACRHMRKAGTKSRTECSFVAGNRTET